MTKDKVVTSLRKYKSIGRAYSRRLILQWLGSNIVSTKTLIDRINSVGFYLYELCIGVTGKERELRLLPRLFAFLPLEPRLYFVISEHLLANNILDYFLQVTMGSSDIQ